MCQPWAVDETIDCPPTRTSSAIGRAQATLAERWDDWLAADLIPTEQSLMETRQQSHFAMEWTAGTSCSLPGSSSRC